MIVDGNITDHRSENAIINGWAIGGDGVERLGTTGIFTGIIMAVLAVQLYRLCVTKKWVIKMPEESPIRVARAFTIDSRLCCGLHGSYHQWRISCSRNGYFPNHCGTFWVCYQFDQQLVKV